MGRALWEKEEDLTPESPNQGNPGIGGELYKGPTAFCKERWWFWKERFQSPAFEGTAAGSAARRCRLRVASPDDSFLIHRLFLLYEAMNQEPTESKHF